MADQAINALSTKTAPETSDQLLLVGAGEPQLIDYDKLADAILNKITSKNYALDAGQMTLLAALNKLNSDLTAKVYAYTPSFSWSKGTVNPTVENITAYFSQYGKVCFAYVRYNITDLGIFNKESFLEITLPSDITSLVTSVSLVSPYQIVGSNTTLGTRISSNKVIIVDGVGCNYSAEYIRKGYQGFSVFFITK